jgi:hypothetical protein
MRPSSTERASSAERIDEHIDVLRIRLWNPTRATVLISEFQSADRVLARWGLHADRDHVGFEIVFADGTVVSGSHEFFRNGKRRCLFSTHVRRLMDQAARSRYAIPG